MATLIKHESGIFLAQFYDRSRRPLRKRVSLKTRNRRTAERLLDKLESRYLLGDFDPWTPEPPPGARTSPDVSLLGPAVKAYMASCSHLSPHTLRTYRSIFKLFREHLGDERRVASLRPDDALAFLDSTKANAVTRRKYLNHLGYLFRYLVRHGAMEQDISKKVKLPRLPEQAPKSMTPDEADQLVRYIHQHAEDRTGDRRIPDYRWLADIIHANVYLGLRLSEVVYAKWEHVNLEARTFIVRNTEEFTTKTGKERVIPIPAPAYEVLERLHERRNGLPWVFTSHIGKLKLHYLSQWFLKFRKLAGLPDGITFHSTRHTYGTWLAERGVPVAIIKELMGHASITTTERYIKARPTTTQHWVDKAFGVDA